MGRPGHPSAFLKGGRSSRRWRSGRSLEDDAGAVAAYRISIVDFATTWFDHSRKRRAR